MQKYLPFLLPILAFVGIIWTCNGYSLQHFKSLKESSIKKQSVQTNAVSEDQKSIEKVYVDLQTVPKESRHEEYLKMVQANRAAAAERRARRAPKAMRRRELLFKVKSAQQQKDKEVKAQRRKAKLEKEITHPLTSLEEGMEVTGVITNVEKFGCFVDIGAERDGLLHIKDMDVEGWVVRASDVVETGDEVKVLIKFCDPMTNKLGLSMRPSEKIREIDLDKDPLTEFDEGDELWGIVTKVTNFGAFVDCGAEVDGFLHLMDYPDRIKGRPATESFYKGMRLRVYVKEVELSKKRMKVTHVRPEWLPAVW
mmetsp:Transcript_27849/g.36535  ORF Transcript_27849/g.36535 Transcript_27849/m.36535 type:complete len:310 (-) Transcript_27849:142-1071(-)